MGETFPLTPRRIDWAPLARQRRRLNLSQADLARHAGVSRQTVWRLEAGRMCPSTEIAFRLAAALGTPLWQLVEIQDA